MKKILLLLISFLLVLFLSGCTDSFARLSLTKDKAHIKLEVICAEDDFERKNKLMEEGYKIFYDPKVFYEENVYTVIPDSLVNKFKLLFNDGVFFITKDNRTVGLDKKYLKQYEGQGKQLELKKLEENKYELILPLEKTVVADQISGLIIFSHYKPLLEWIDPTNILHDDSDMAKMTFIPFSGTKKAVDGSDYLLIARKSEAKGSDLGNGFIVFGLLNLNSAKSRDYVGKRTVWDGFYGYNNYGSNFIIPWPGIVNCNDSKKLRRPDELFHDVLGIISLSRGSARPFIYINKW